MSAVAKRARRADGEATLERILDTALKLFRKRGFERTTMRDIAAGASVSLGAAYHYFASKDAIVLHYYVRRERDLADTIGVPLAAAKDLRERLGVMMHGKLELFRSDRRLLSALFRAATDPESAVSVFAEETSAIRIPNVARFAEALRDEPIDDAVRAVAAEGLWIVHLGLVLFFLHDKSPGQKRSHALVDHVLDLSVDLVRLITLPGMDELRGRITRILIDVMTPSPAPASRHIKARPKRAAKSARR